MKQINRPWSLRAAALLLCLLVTLLPILSACRQEQQLNTRPYDIGTLGGRNDIFILFTGDVHGADAENIGYAGLAAYKAELETRSDYVTLVDTGDAVQGSYAAMVSQGGYAVELMNRVGYDFAVPGNHEFDYGMSRLNKLIDTAEAQYLGCNISYTGEGQSALDELKAYEIVSYGDTRVAYIGVVTPYTMTDTAPTNFQENGEYVYDFLLGENGASFYQRVQENVDACRAKGADFVVLLAHLGDAEEYAPFSSTDLIGATTGVDVVLDGHAHKTIPGRMVSDRDGEEVLLASTGTELENIGQLLITPSGNISVSLISNYSKRDEVLADYITQNTAKNEQQLSEKVANSNYELSIYGEDGARLVRNRETAVGNLVADAFRSYAQSDIAFINGDGVRASLPKGNITYGDVMDLQPYGNVVYKLEATGAEIMDALELAYRTVQSEASEKLNGIASAVGENGGFFQISGLRLTVDTSIASTVELDANENFVAVRGERRVKNIEILQNDGSYAALVPDQIYTVASIDYILKDGGGGCNIFTDNTFVDIGNKMDYQVVLQYLKSFANTTLPEVYRATEGRITIQ